MSDERVTGRAAGAPPEEAAAGTDVPEQQARAVLEDSDRRQADRDAAPSSVVEHRRREETADGVAGDGDVTGGRGAPGTA